MNYKSGDLVTITGNQNGHEFNIGETAKLKRKADGLKPTWIAEYLDGHDYWYVRECDMTPVKPAIMPQKIIITTDGKTTLARLFDGKKMVKRAEAKCAPSDTFDFGVGAELAVRRLMGENPVTEPIKESEPVKLYCVKSHEPGEWITKGKIYELDADGIIHFDDGYSLEFRGIGDHASVKLNLVPLVRRPAKVGEWVIAASSDGHRAKLNVPYAVSRVGKSNPDWVYVVADSDDTCIRDDQYLVLDGYAGDPA